MTIDKTMEKKRYITFDKRLIEAFAALGFKRKNQDTFLRMQNEALQRIGFTHSVHGERHVKYYNLSLYVEYPKVNELIKSLQYDYYDFDGFQINIGYLKENPKFQQYRVADEDNDETVLRVIENMAHDVEHYGLPFFDKYSTIDAAIKGMETHEITFTALSVKRSLPVFYLSKGWPESALSYVNSREEQEIKGYEKQVAECLELRKLHGDDNVEMPPSRFHQDYIRFANLIREYVNGHAR